MSGHTPGSWVHHPKDNIITTHDGRVTLEWQARSNHALSGNMSIEERDANARLIAAAPELLEALERLLAAYTTSYSSEYRMDCWKQARAAIAKAKGEA